MMTFARVVRTPIAVAAITLTANAALAGEDWQVPGDFATIQLAIDSELVLDGDTIRVGPGEHFGAIVTKSVEIKGEGGATISDGPFRTEWMSYGIRLDAGSDGATISHLNFTVGGLDIYNAGSVNDVTVTQCNFENALQAVSNWSGSGWEITHNTIHDLRTHNGGGIGILVADWRGVEVIDNLVAHNKITGTLHVWEEDGGNYAGTGIVLYADFRWGRDGTTKIWFNRIIKNTVSLESDAPETVPAYAFELTDTRNVSGQDEDDMVVKFNTIGFNNWRDSTNQVSLTPSDLDASNSISRNFGDNRGHGLHPSLLFGPGQ